MPVARSDWVSRIRSAVLTRPSLNRFLIASAFLPRGHAPCNIAVVGDGLWGLIVGDPVAGGADSLWFSAGPDDESHGLLGMISPN